MSSQQHQKIVNVSYLALAGLIAFIALTVLMKLADVYDLESKLKSAELLIRAGSLGVGLAVFLVLYRNEKANVFMNEVASELLTKVTWPTRRDTLLATAVVMVTVVIAGLILAMFDWFWIMVLKWVL